MKKYVALLFFVANLMACSPSTHIEQSWKEPGASTTITSNTKVFVVVFAKDEGTRRKAEDQIVSFMKGNGVPSYTHNLIATKGADTNAIAATLLAEGFEYAIVTRLVDKEKETTYVPGTTSYYGGFRGFYGYGYGGFSSPGYYVEDKVYTIVTNVFDVKRDKLVWSAISKTTNPGKMDKEFSIYIEMLADRMRKDGLLK